MNLCDLHTHVLPGVDDGAYEMADALQMLRNAVASDVKVLAVTPHCNNRYGDGNYMQQSLKDRFLRLQQEAKDIPVQLVLGAEAWVNEQLPQLLQQGMIPTINGGRYLLTEFPVDTKEGQFIPMLQKIIQLGYIPLIAHPERYNAVCAEPETVVQWLDMGCHLQLTGGSILGEYGKTVQRTATCLLKGDLVACIASDAHGLHKRSNFLMEVYDHLAVRYSRAYANCLFWQTPLRICRDEDI